MLVTDKLSRFRDALTLSGLLLVLPAINLAQEANRLQLSPPALQAAQLIDVESQLGPQPPCGDGRTGLGRFLLGSVSEAVARHARCSVQIVKIPS
jgi:hypothetical protein